MKEFLTLAAVLCASTVAFAQAPQPRPASLSPAPTSVFDGQWRGISDSGACAPLEVVLSIEYGLVDGTAFDTGARGPQPNPSKAAAPAATPRLWQLHGAAGNGASFTLLATASVRVAADRRTARITVRRDGGGLVLSEDSGCKRTARLAKS